MIRTIRGTPQTRLSTVVKKELIASHIIINLLFLLKSVIYCTAGKQSNNRPFQKSEVQKILFIYSNESAGMIKHPLSFCLRDSRHESDNHL